MRKRTYLLQVATFVVAVLDIIGLGSMVPVLMLAVDHQFLDKSSKLRYIYKLLGFNTEPQFLIFLICAIFIFFLAKNLFAYLITNQTAKNAAKINLYLSNRSFDRAFYKVSYNKVSSVGLKFPDQLIFNPFYYVSGVYLPLMVLISEGTVSALMLMFFCIYKPIVFIPLALILSLAVTAVMWFFKRKTEKLGVEIGEKREDSLEKINFGLQGFFDIRNYTAQAFFKARFNASYKPYVELGSKANVMQLLPARVLEIITLAGIILLVVYAYFVSDNLGQARTIAAMFVIAIFRLLPAANRIMQSLLKIRLNAYTINRLKKDTQLVESLNLSMEYSLEVKNINYKYKGDPVVTSGEFCLRKGEIVGLGGESGSGKTSFVRLLLGDIDADNCLFEIDGKAQSPLDISRLIASLGQEHFVFAGTVSQNVCLCEVIDAAQEKRVQEALQQASFYIDDVIDIMGHKLLDNGQNLSEGQKQRLSIARLLYANKPIVILDEPTSSLDASNENEIIKTIKMLKEQGKAILLIAHSPRMFEICSTIYTIDNKRITKTKNG